MRLRRAAARTAQPGAAEVILFPPRRIARRRRVDG
jgi:hypothetical protein